MEPLVTVLMPVYNGRKYLKEAIESILNQTYKNIDFLIIDDGSTDDSVKVVMSYNDSRIKLVKNEQNIGLTAILNKGVELSNGQYIARMDADDISASDRLEKQVNYLEQHPDVCMVDSIMELMDAQGNSLNKYNSDVISEKDIRNSLPKNNYLGHSSIMIRAGIMRKYKYRTTEAEDYDLWLQLANDNYIIHKIDEPLLLYRLHGSSYTDNHGRKQSRGTLRLAITKYLYLTKLPFKKRFTLFNIKVLYYTILQYIIGYIKYAVNYNNLIKNRRS